MTCALIASVAYIEFDSARYDVNVPVVEAIAPGATASYLSKCWIDDTLGNEYGGASQD